MAVATVIHTPMCEYLDSASIEARKKGFAPTGKVAPLLGTVTPLRSWVPYASERQGSISVEEDPVLQIQPRTPIAAALLRARRAYLEAGGKLLGWDELEEEMRQLRGGLAQGRGALWRLPHERNDSPALR
jgi:hypothetical protein